ncbi:MAG: preprotein translocase subunit YajC [Aridibacter sp.]|jgi:preprotein translocase subunit YajC|nr:preprotein translocase subunit YajC [Acidobacteriota bacterium]
MNTIMLFFQGSGFIWTIMPLVLIFGIFYFLVILPQKKQQQRLTEMIAALKIGDEVVTNGGIIGKIIEVRETSFIIRSAEKSNMEIGKAAVVGKRGDEEVTK